MLKSLPNLAMAQLILPNQHFVEIELSSSSGHNSNVSHSIIPSDATELINSYENGSWDLTKMSGNSDNFEFKSDIWQSLTKYPEGDEEWSNSIELVNPLAAWIATPARNRPSRWVRISSKLTGNWVDLMNCEVTPPKLLLGGLGSASEDWKMKAIKLLAQHFLYDNQHLIEAKKGVQSSHELSALSTAVLLICDKLSDEFTNMSESLLMNGWTHPYSLTMCSKHCSSRFVMLVMIDSVCLKKLFWHRRFIQKIRYCIIGANMSNL